MIITLAGTPGSGKSSIGKIMAEELGYEFLSMGAIRRKFAMDKGMTLEELNEKAKTDPESDKLVDEYLIELGKKDKYIIDGRLAWYFIPHSFKVWVYVSEEEGAKRIFSHNREEEKYESKEDLIKRSRERMNEDKERYKELYEIDDFSSENNYDFVIDTTSITAQQAADMILEEIKKT